MVIGDIIDPLHKKKKKKQLLLDEVTEVAFLCIIRQFKLLLLV